MTDRILKCLIIVLALSMLLFIAVLGFRAWAYSSIDPYLIDYDAPGVDITSEGP